jgi:hypothetical protein
MEVAAGGGGLLAAAGHGVHPQHALHAAACHRQGAALL